jgi:choice-of-anchor B domain-containing protein
MNTGTHNLAVDEVGGFLYLAGGGRMRVYDLSDPSDPTQVGTWGDQAHDAQVVTYTEGPYAGRQIAFVYAGWDGWLDIVDVTDKSNMFPIGRANYPSPVYTHQGWLTADRQYLYLNDEVDEIARTTIIDVSDLSNPTFVADFSTGLPSTDHNLYVKDGFIFAANYTSGLRIFDVSDPVNPVQVGFFDTFPANDNPGYEGAWNAFPYFPSGTVIVSDRSGGLFVLDVSDAVGSGLPGDLNCDGQIDAFDIEPFLTALFDPAGYPGLYPDCDINLADINGDGNVDAFDIEPFLNLLFP